MDRVLPEGVPQALRDLDLDALLGRTMQDARSMVEAAGGVLRWYDAEHPSRTFDLIPRRVTVRLADGLVREVHAFG
jgi:hypothetical protein